MNAFQTITDFAAENHVKLKTVNVKNPTLEDVFLHLTGRALRD
jgi:ABC-2 type transport system ATP-binding protein